MTKTLGLTLAALASVALVGQASARDQIRIVGSSTVYPFSTAVAEQFGKTTDFSTPIVEANGSGGGAKLFCAGVGVDFPDVTNASRRMKKKEFDLCQANGVTDVIEVVGGYDGIVVANAKDAPAFAVTREQLYLALHKGATATRWNEVDPSLPAIKIEVLGPPPTSGTRDAFEELVMHEGCEAAGGACDAIEIRDDGAYVDAGENDNLIVSKLEANPDALGVFGFSFLDQNSDRLQGAAIDGVEPTFDAIADGDYPVSRPLFFYVKAQHVGVIPGLMEYVQEFTSDRASGEDGYLVDKGLIPLLEDDADAMRDAVLAQSRLTAEEL